MKLVKIIRKIVDWLCIILLATITILVISQVFSRYVLHTPLTWSEELCRYLQAAMVMLGSSVLMREGGHLAIDVAVASLKPKPRFVVDVFVKLVTILFFGLVAYFGIGATANAARQTSAAMMVNMKYVYAVLPIGGGLTCMEGVIDLIHHIKTQNPFQTSVSKEVI